VVNEVLGKAKIGLTIHAVLLRSAFSSLAAGYLRGMRLEWHNKVWLFSRLA
jgi:hypothetical protein